MADRSVVYRLRAEIGQFKAQMAQASASVKDAADKMTAGTKEGEKFRSGLSTLGSTAGKIGLGAAAGLAVVTKAAIDWESAWAGVAKTVDGSDAQMAKLEGSLREMARTLPATHQEIAATAEAAGQLGVATNDVADFTEVMIKLGSSTNLTADAAATSIAQLMNIMQSTPDAVDHIGNALVDLGNKGASTESQILDMSQRLAGAGKLIGASEADVLGMGAAMANLGIEAELGGGAMSRMIRIIDVAVDDGSESLTGFAQIAGMTAEDFAAKWQADPMMAIDAVVQGIGRLNDSGANVTSVLGDLGIKGTQNLDVLLRLAGAGDMVSKSLDQSANAWEENSALTDEFGRRAETTAAQVQVAWNNIKDAAIDAGAAMLPVVEKAAGVVSGMAQAFESLPGPVKSAATGMLGITAVLGGGLWFTSKMINGVADMRTALGNVGISAGNTSRSFGSLAGRTAGILALSQAVGILTSNIKLGNEINVADLDRDIEQIVGGNAPESLKKLAGSLEVVNEAGAGTVNAIASIPGALFGMKTTFGSSTDTIEAFDQKLASLVESGKAEKAAELFQAIRDAAAEHGGVSDDDVVKRFDSYQKALDNVSTSGSDASGSMGELAESTATLSQEQLDAQAAAQDMADKLQQQQDAARETASSFLGLGDSLNDSKVSLGDWIGELEEQAEALKNFRINAEEAADKGLRQGLIKSLQEAGPEGALRMKQLADGTETEIERANKAFRSGRQETKKYLDSTAEAAGLKIETPVETPGLPEAERGVGRYVKQLDNVPPTLESLVKSNAEQAEGKVRGYNKEADKVKPGLSTTITADTGPALAAIARMRAIAAANVMMRVSAIFTGRGSADGSTVPKDGGSYADRYLYMLAPGEEVISNRFGQADKNRAALKAANRGAKLAVVGGLASGGTAKGKTVRSHRGADLDYAYQSQGLADILGVQSTLKGLKGALKGLEGAADAASASLDATKDSLDAAQSARDALISGITGGLSRDPWESSGGSGTSWNTLSGAGGMSLAGANASLQSQIAEANEFNGLIEQLKTRGLGGSALLSIISTGDIERARAAAAGTDAELATYNSLYGQRDVASQQAAQMGAAMSGLEAAYQQALAVNQAAYVESQYQSQRLDDLNRTVDLMQKQQEESRKNQPKRDAANAAAVGSAVASGNSQSAKNASAKAKKNRKVSSGR